MRELDRFVLTAPTAPGALDGGVTVLWHGAGGDVDHPTMLAIADAFAGAGGTVARARFAYRRMGRRVPDRMPALLADASETLNAIADVLGARPSWWLLGGRSMGGRVASHLAASAESVRGLLLLSYPLHPPKRREQRRDEHLPALKTPMLFVAGDRDDFASATELRALVATLGRKAKLELFEGADHSFSRKVDHALVAKRALTWAKKRAPRA